MFNDTFSLPWVFIFNKIIVLLCIVYNDYVLICIETDILNRFRFFGRQILAMHSK